MARASDALFSEIRTASADVVNFCLAPLFEELRTSQIACPLNYLEFNGSIEIHIGPLKGNKKETARLNMLAHCLRAVHINSGVQYSKNGDQVDFFAYLRADEKTVTDLKKARQLAEQCERFSSVYQDAQAALTNTFSEKEAAQMMGDILKKNDLQIKSQSHDPIRVTAKRTYYYSP